MSVAQAGIFNPDFPKGVVHKTLDVRTAFEQDYQKVFQTKVDFSRVGSLYKRNEVQEAYDNYALGWNGAIREIIT